MELFRGKVKMGSRLYWQAVLVHLGWSFPVSQFSQAVHSHTDKLQGRFLSCAGGWGMNTEDFLEENKKLTIIKKAHTCVETRAKSTVGERVKGRRIKMKLLWERITICPSNYHTQKGSLWWNHVINTELKYSSNVDSCWALTIFWFTLSRK